MAIVDDLAAAGGAAAVLFALDPVGDFGLDGLRASSCWASWQRTSVRTS